mmetsp:Transcript_64152/g.150569  ORF Transcript_64152/g.150569 Transcript_64152/m.150569 type:complete len:286 (+) Transcript_64152:147-1004(+)
MAFGWGMLCEVGLISQGLSAKSRFEDCRFGDRTAEEGLPADKGRRTLMRTSDVTGRGAGWLGCGVSSCPTPASKRRSKSRMSSSSPRSCAPFRRRRMAANGAPASASPSSPAVRSDEASVSTCGASPSDLLLVRVEEAYAVDPPDELPQAVRLVGKKPVPGRPEPICLEDRRVVARDVQELGPGRSARFTDSITSSCSEGSSAACVLEVSANCDSETTRAAPSWKAATAVEASVSSAAGTCLWTGEACAFARLRNSFKARSPKSSVAAKGGCVSVTTCFSSCAIP